MKLLTPLFLWIFSVSAFQLPIQNENSFRIVGEQHRRNAADLKAYHLEQRAKAASVHKLYDPDWPADPVITFIEIGKSKQKFYVSVEGGKDKIWVLDCAYQFTKPGVETFNSSDPNSSAVVLDTFYIDTGSYGYVGRTYKDVIWFFGVTADQNFGSVYESTDLFLPPTFTDNVSGAIGLSWHPELKDDAITSASAPVFHYFAAHPELPRYFIQWLELDPTSKFKSLSTISFGSPLNNHCSSTPLTTAPLSFHPLALSLSFQVDSFSFGTNEFKGDFMKIDGGLPVFSASEEIFDVIYNIINPDYDYEYEVYTTNCEIQLDDFVFTIGGVDLNVPSSSYIVDLDMGHGRCVVAIAREDQFTLPLAIGVPFLMNFCVKWDIDHSAISFFKPLA